MSNEKYHETHLTPKTALIDVDWETSAASYIFLIYDGAVAAAWPFQTDAKESTKNIYEKVEKSCFIQNKNFFFGRRFSFISGHLRPGF